MSSLLIPFSVLFSRHSISRWLNLLLCLGLGLELAVLFITVADGFTFGRTVFAGPASITVTTNSDELNTDGDCSLREAIQAANTNVSVDTCTSGSSIEADTILLPAEIYTLTIEGAGDNSNLSGDLDITDAAGLSLSGAGRDTTILNANGVDRMLHAIQGTLSLSNLTVENGIYTGAYFKGPGIVINTTFINNSNGGDNDGGGAYFYTTATVTSSTFISNVVYEDVGYGGSGGGAYFYGPASIISTTFEGNKAAFNGGGATFVGPTSVINSTFAGNTVDNLTSTFESRGGGAYFNSSASVTSTIFIHNTADAEFGYGGGAAFSGMATVTGTTFLSNTASGSGGAAFSGPASVVRTSFIGNSAIGSPGSSESGIGGAGFAETANVVDSTFIGNTSLAGVGGAFFYRAATVIRSTFRGNSASGGHGGGAYFGGNGASATKSVVVIDSIFTGNSASQFGGGLYIYGRDTMTVTGSTFRDNTANLGGGAYFGGPYPNRVGIRNVNGTMFTGNMANLGGGAYLGGVDQGGDGQTAWQIVNVLFAANRATEAGMAMYADDDYDDNNSYRILHTTITSPTVGVGSAMVVVSGTVYLTNTLISSYTVGIERQGGKVSEDYTLFSGVTLPYSGTITSGGHSITGTAAFYDTVMYTLTAVSDALDTGVNVGVTTDFEGNPRPIGIGFDIGWDEWIPPLNLKFYIPFIERLDNTVVLLQKLKHLLRLRP